MSLLSAFVTKTFFAGGRVLLEEPEGPHAESAQKIRKRNQVRNIKGRMPRPIVRFTYLFMHFSAATPSDSTSLV